MSQYRIKIFSFSFGDQGTNADEYILPVADSTATLEINITTIEFAKLSGLKVPENSETNAKRALGFETGQILPSPYNQAAIKFTVPSGQTFWFPNCKLHPGEGTISFTSYIYEDAGGERWCAEINGVKMNCDMTTRLNFEDQDRIP